MIAVDRWGKPALLVAAAVAVIGVVVAVAPGPDDDPARGALARRAR